MQTMPKSGRHHRRATGAFAAILLAWAGLSPAAPAATADSWSAYANPRFCYGVDVPPGFTVAAEPDNGDGVTLASKDSGARLLVWGANIVEGDFKSDAAGRADGYRHDGWQISLRRIGDGKASVSGSRKDRILYLRGIDLGDGQVAYFELDYPRAGLKAFDPVVDRLVRSLAKGQDCTGQ
jgi:hypothetical protein